MKVIDGKIYMKYSEVAPEQKMWYYGQIQKFLKKLVFEYRGFQKWFTELFISEDMLKPDREIIICEYDHQMAGVVILKDDGIEKKICTLRVAEPFQKQRIGRNLMELSFEWLNDEKPLITIHNSKKNEFQRLFKRYDFKLEEEKWGYYRLFSSELVYNGILPEKKFFLGHIEIIDLEKEIKQFLFSGEKDFNIFLEQWLQGRLLSGKKWNRAIVE